MSILQRWKACKSRNGDKTPETGTTTQGETIEEALANLREATELYLEEFPLHVMGCPFLTTFEVAPHAA